jgi:GT2 family glycosyltransferase
MNVGVVIPVGPDRHDNLREVLACLNQQTYKPECIALVFDGHDCTPEDILGEEAAKFTTPVMGISLPKHTPGQEQPRNVGVRLLQRFGRCEYAWFLDSDVLVQADCLEQFRAAKAAAPHRTREAIILGPYDWLPPGVRQPVQRLKNDPRWPSFDERKEQAVLNDLSAGLACFSGNLIWPISEFARVGGFWNEIHHGRCEDGELGLRAVAMGVPIVFAAEARGWHMDHPRNMEWIEAANARDVPMLNARHPWVQGSGMFVVEEDGKRFDVRCPCGWEGNTALIWQHESECPNRIQAVL